MAMAPATRAPGGAVATRLVSKSGFSVASPVRLPRRAVVLGVAARSGRRDGRPGADSNSSSSSSGGGGGGRLVDADMATLRRRIREARAESAEEDGIDADSDEAEDGVPLPAAWTELERRHHMSYVAGVRGAVALLEALLVSARPGLGAGLLAMLLLGVPASMFLVCTQLVQALDSVSSGLLTGR